MPSENFDPSKWIHLRELARLLGVDPTTLSRRLQRKGAPAVLRVGRRAYIRRDDIDNPYLRLT